MMMSGSEEVTLAREVGAVLIPSGDPTTLGAGVRVRITQSLGGTFTVITENGQLARIEAYDADALGKTSVARATPDEPREFSEALVWEQLRTCYDPEIPVNIVELGLIYGCEISEPEPEGRRIRIQMTLTAPGCGMGSVLQADIERKLSKLPGVVEAKVELVLDPPWSPERMSEAAKLELGMM